MISNSKFTVRTRLPEDNLPENMRIESEEQLLGILERRIKNHRGEYYTIDQVREHFRQKEHARVAV